MSTCGADCRGCGLQLMQVLVTVMALPGASGLGDQVSLPGTPLGLVGDDAPLTDAITTVNPTKMRDEPRELASGCPGSGALQSPASESR